MTYELMTDREVATYLKLSPKSGWRTIRRWVDEGRIKYGRAGHFLRFRKEDVDDFVFNFKRD